jgi:branched-chain amino acid transport system permease protein
VTARVERIRSALAATPGSRWLAKPWLNGLLILAVALLVTSNLGADDYISYQVQLGAIFAIAALGLNVTAGMAGALSLGAAAFLALGGYATAILAGKHGWPIWGTVPGATLIGFAGGAVLGWPASRLGHIGIAMVSLGCTLVVGDVALRAGSLTGGYGGISNIPPVLSFNSTEWVSTGLICTIILVATYVAYVAHWRYRTSRLGRATVAMRDNEIGARAQGIKVERTLMLAFAAGAAGGALAGSLYAYLVGVVTPDTFGVNMSITLLAMVILGGVGSQLGPLVGAGILTALPIYLARFPQVNQFLYGGLLVLVILFLPRGLIPARPPAMSAPPREELDAEEAADAAPTPAAATSPVLRLDDVSRHFGGVYALRGVSLDVLPGEVMSIVGPNGSGKTTLLNAICGYSAPSSGQVLLNGKPLPTVAARAADLGIGRTFQTPRTFASMSVAEHLWVARDHELQANRPTEHGVVARDLLERTGLDELLHGRPVRPARMLAHGQLRFLEVATAISRAPAVLLLDEPAAGLSAREIELLEDAVRRVVATGTAVIFVEHHLDLVRRVSDRVSVLHLGELLWSGPPSELHDAEAVRAAYLGLPNREGMAAPDTGARGT